MLSKNEQLLAALIFVLWSLGVVLIPTLTEQGIGVLSLALSFRLLQALTTVYLLLHVIIFGFTLYALSVRYTRGRMRGPNSLLPLLLYGYTIVMLCISVYLLLPIVPAIYQ